MNKIPLALVLGSVLVVSAFGMVAYQFTQIRERLVYPYLAKKKYEIPTEGRVTIKNFDSTDGLIVTSVNTQIETRSAAIFFPNELLDFVKLAEKLSALKQKYTLVVVPVYRGTGIVSSTWPRENLMFQDAHTVAKYIQDQGYSLHYLGGERLGAAIAAYLASKQVVKQLELVDPWQSTSQAFAKVPLLTLLKFLGWDDYAIPQLLRNTEAEEVSFDTSEQYTDISVALRNDLPAHVKSQLTVRK